MLKHTTTICGVLMSQSVEEMVSDMYKAKAQGADVVELRLDCLKTLCFPQDLHLLLDNKPLPVIIVYRYFIFTTPVLHFYVYVYVCFSPL